MAWSGRATMGRHAPVSDVRLSKYNPRPRILCFDDFDEGINRWCELVGNHTGILDQIRPIAKDFRPPQLSSCTFFAIGTHGSVDGTYSLKLATRPLENHSAVAIKRMTYAERGGCSSRRTFPSRQRSPASRPPTGTGTRPHPSGTLGSSRSRTISVWASRALGGTA